MHTYIIPFVKSAYQKKSILFINENKPCGYSSQPKHTLWVLKKNSLNEMVLLSTQNICWNWWVKRYLQFYTHNLCLSKPMIYFSATIRNLFNVLQNEINYLYNCPANWLHCTYSKTCVKRPLSKRPKIGFQTQLFLNAGQTYCRMLQGEHSAILSTSLNYHLSISLCFVYLEWPLYTGITVQF